MVSRIIKIKKINQSYFFNLINKYQKISSGRKNYSLHYKRIIKNILLTKLYEKNIIPNKNFFDLKEHKSSVKIWCKSK